MLIANLYQLSIMSAFFNYLWTLRPLFISLKICSELTVFNNISSVPKKELRILPLKYELTMNIDLLHWTR